jgi:hypothetical protein
VDPRTGKKRYYSEAVKGTKTLAQRRLTELLRETDTGTFVEPTGLTVEEYLEQWLRDSAAPRVSGRTWRVTGVISIDTLYPMWGKFHWINLPRFTYNKWKPHFYRAAALMEALFRPGLCSNSKSSLQGIEQCSQARNRS